MDKRFKGRDFLTLMDFTREEITHILNVSYEFKMKSAIGEPHEYLRGKTLAAIFEKPSTRTRNSFQVAAAQLGAQSFYIRPDELQLSRGESVKDTACVLDRYYDGLFIRTAYGTGQQELNDFAQYMKIPVMNACTDYTHPCQGLCDLLTIKEKKGDLQGLKVAFVADPWNVCHTTMIAGALMGFDVYVALPEGYEPDKEIITFSEKAAQQSGSRIVITRDLKTAVTDADVVYAYSFYSVGKEDEREKRAKDFGPFQINEESVSIAKPDFIFMHPGPAHPGQEVTEEVIQGPHSVYYDQAENRLHTHKAVLALFISG